jgi:dsRNA-specific ribonuclease
VLNKVASTTGLEEFIHGRRVELMSLFDKIVPELPMLSVVRAVEAIVGAVFVDGGSSNLESVKAVMNHLGLKIKKGRYGTRASISDEDSL